MTLPGSGKSFDQFRADEYECRQYAYEQVGGNTPRQASRVLISVQNLPEFRVKQR